MVKLARGIQHPEGLSWGYHRFEGFNIPKMNNAMFRDPKALYVNKENIFKGRKKATDLRSQPGRRAHGRLVVAPTVLLAVSILAAATILFRYLHLTYT